MPGCRPDRLRYGESAAEAKPETDMCCCVCRWEWLELGGNTEVMVCCERRDSLTRLQDGKCEEGRGEKERRLLWWELCWWQVQASLNLEPVEPQGQTGEKPHLKIIIAENNRIKLTTIITNYEHYRSYWFIMTNYILWGEKHWVEVAE